MNQIFNQKARISIRRLLRNNIPQSEKILWKKIKRKQINGYKFRRQQGIGKYVVDFYCPRLSLVIEIDGANHFFDEKSDEYDIQRQKYLESLGLKVLRFTNTDICNGLNNVLDVIYFNLPLPPPSDKEGGRNTALSSKKKEGREVFSERRNEKREIFSNKEEKIREII